MKARIRNGEAPKPDSPPPAPTVDTVETYAKKLKLREKQLARATMVGILTSLGALMSAAVEDDDCPVAVNPAAKLVKLLKDPKEKKSRRLTKDKYFERDEATDLLAAAREHFTECYAFAVRGIVAKSFVSSPDSGIMEGLTTTQSSPRLVRGVGRQRAAVQQRFLRRILCHNNLLQKSHTRIVDGNEMDVLHTSPDTACAHNPQKGCQSKLGVGSRAYPFTSD